MEALAGDMHVLVSPSAAFHMRVGVTQVIKITVGWWDDDALLAARVMPRAGALLPNASIILESETCRVAVGLQCHQDIITVSARFIATMWLFVPGGALITRVSEALHVSPLRVPEHFVSDTAFARWGPDFSSLEADDDGQYPNENDEAVVVMNSSKWDRALETFIELSHAATEIWCMLAPSRLSASFMMITMIFYEVRTA